MRGVESKGMLAAGSEIGLTDKEDGLLILDPDFKIGTPVQELYDNDTLIEVEITPNRPDLLSHSLHELGQPLHAFDASKVALPLNVRPATEGEKFKALDEETYDLKDIDCVISDQSNTPLALAGVMGGLESGVTDTTTDVLLESAYFTTSEIRRTSRRLFLTSDSSYRFERGVDPQQVLPASALAAALILEIAASRLKTLVPFSLA